MGTAASLACGSLQHDPYNINLSYLTVHCIAHSEVCYIAIILIAEFGG